MLKNGKLPTVGESLYMFFRAGLVSVLGYILIYSISKSFTGILPLACFLDLFLLHPSVINSSPVQYFMEDNSSNAGSGIPSSSATAAMDDAVIVTGGGVTVTNRDARILQEKLRQAVTDGMLYEGCNDKGTISMAAACKFSKTYL